MDSPTRWSAVAAVGWRATMSFARRRLEFVEKLEQHNLPIASFSDAPDHFGVAPLNEAQRMRLERKGLRVELRSPSGDLGLLQQPLGDVFTLFADVDPVPLVYMAAWSMPLKGDYSRLAQRLAAQTAGHLPPQLGVATDCAYLLDLKTPTGPVKIEYGVVSRSELEHRLRNGDMGRLASAVGLPRPDVSELDAKRLPAVSLYVEAFCTPTVERPVGSFEQFRQFFDGNEDVVRSVVYPLATRLDSE